MQLKRNHKFHQNSIDFVQTYVNFAEKYKPSVVCRKSFGAPIVRMANAVITTYFDQGSIKGVKKCLEYEIKILRWRNHIWIIPMSENRLFEDPYSEQDREFISLLADSLILTIIAYRIQLNETHSGLANIVYNELIAGFEWVCDWISRGVNITPEKNDIIATLNIDHLMQFIPEG